MKPFAPITPRVWRIALAALAAFAALGVYGVHFSPVSADRLQARLQTAADRALDAREHGWASARIDGQVAAVSGRAPGETVRLDALAAVGRAAWAGGTLSGGVTRVIDNTTLARPGRGFEFRADAANGRVILVGETASETVRDALSAHANAVFPAGAEIGLAVFARSGADAEREEAARRLISFLSRLDSGAAVIAGHDAVIYGATRSEDAAREVAAGIGRLPRGWRGGAWVRAGDRAVTVIPGAAGCAALMEAARGPAAFRFNPGAAVLVPASQEAARRAGEVARDCPVGRIIVSVRSAGDPSAVAARNLALARARAVIEAMQIPASARIMIEPAPAPPGQVALVRFMEDRG